LPPAPGEIVWLDDALPPGATARSDNDVWQWVNSNPAPILGNGAHQSKIAAGMHQHQFDGATFKLPVNAGDILYTYVFIDPDHVPKEIMLQWHDGTSWEHRAYWGEDRISFGANGTNSRRRMGSIPTKSGTWIRLEVPATQVGLEGTLVSGMAFTLFDGSATWDRAGKFSAPPSATIGPEVVWVDDAPPDGAVTSEENDCWRWGTSAPAPFNGPRRHQSFDGTQSTKGRYHSFTSATPLEIQPGDVLFAYVFIDPAARPDTILLEWFDGTSRNHRAFWGQPWSSHGGIVGTESRRYMGDLPPANQWVRLEIPASYVGLEGKSISGMSFGTHREAGGTRKVYWDYAGKTRAAPLTTPARFHATTPLFRFYRTSGARGYRLSTVNLALGAGFNEQAQDTQGYIFPNQAAGTEPLYFFTDNNGRYFYGIDRNGPIPTVWTYQGIAGYVYRYEGVPGAISLHRFRHRDYGYIYSTNRQEFNGNSAITYDGIACFVLGAPSPAPNAPGDAQLFSITNAGGGGYNLRWLDNSLDESGFLIEKTTDLGLNFAPFATVAANTTTLAVGGHSESGFRVRAFNAEGESAFSNVAAFGDRTAAPATQTATETGVLNPVAEEVVGVDFSVLANASHPLGAGSILKTEFYKGTVKIGEALNPPYIYYWRNAPPGSHTLTAKVTDNTGAVTVSPPVNFTVYDFR
jgi:hypothetical protein